MQNWSRQTPTTSSPPSAGWSWAMWPKPKRNWPRSARRSRSTRTCWRCAGRLRRSRSAGRKDCKSRRALLRRAPSARSGWLHQAYALRRVPDGGVQKAWEALLPAFEKFPKEPTIPFNLCLLRLPVAATGRRPGLAQARDGHRRQREDQSRWRSTTPTWSRSGRRSGSFNGSGGERGAGWQPA